MNFLLLSSVHIFSHQCTSCLAVGVAVDFTLNSPLLLFEFDH